MSEIDVEHYQGGFILADYSGKRGRFSISYAGKNLVWKDRPLGLGETFATKEEAYEARAKVQ